MSERYKVRKLKGRWWVIDTRKPGTKSYLTDFATKAEAWDLIKDLRAEDRLYGEGWEENEEDWVEDEEK